MSPATATLSVLNPVTDWNAIRALPEGAALADAYLTLREAFGQLTVSAQLLANGQGGMTPEALGQEVGRLIPLLQEPYGRAWTDAYWSAELRRSRATSALRESLKALAGEGAGR